MTHTKASQETKARRTHTHGHKTLHDVTHAVTFSTKNKPGILIIPRNGWNLLGLIGLGPLLTRFKKGCEHRGWLWITFNSQGGRRSLHSELALIPSCCHAFKLHGRPHLDAGLTPLKTSFMYIIWAISWLDLWKSPTDTPNFGWSQVWPVCAFLCHKSKQWCFLPCFFPPNQD